MVTPIILGIADAPALHKFFREKQEKRKILQIWK